MTIPESVIELSSLFFSAFISTTIAPGGSEAVLAYLVSTGHTPLLLLLAVASVGNTLGAITTWWLGILAAQKIPLSTSLSTRHQKAFTIIRQRGLWILLFSWLPIIGDALCFAGGWLGLPLLSASLLIFIGKLGRYALIVWFFV